MRYSALDDPLMRIVDSGGCREAGLREIFEHASQIDDLDGALPLERYSMLRLLIAFAADMFHPENSRARKELLRAGHFDMKVFDDYVSDCEKDAPRFLLFDPVHPFMQARFDAKLDEGKLKAAANLIITLPSGNNHVFLDHRMEDMHAITPAEAFRGMYTLYTFCTAGAQGYPSSVNITPPLYVAAIGRNLFETIVLNMPSQAELGNQPYGLGDVPWRGENIVVPKQAFQELSYLSAMTWQPRRITLTVDDDGLVRSAYLQQGHNFQGNGLWADPAVPFRKKKDAETYHSVKPESGRALWRDVGTLILDRKGKYAKSPLVLSCLPKLYEEDELDNAHVRLVGLVTNKAKLEEWIEDETSFPYCLLENEAAADLLRGDVLEVEDFLRAVTRNTAKLLENAVAEQAKTQFLHQAHAYLFGPVMRNLVELKSDGTDYIAEKSHIHAFEDGLRKILKEVLSNVIHHSGSDTHALICQTQAETNIFRAVGKIVKDRGAVYGT